MKLRFLFLLTIMIFSGSLVFATSTEKENDSSESEQKTYKNFKSRRWSEEIEEFTLLGIRFFEGKKDFSEEENIPEFVVLDLVFSREVDPLTVRLENITLNNKFFGQSRIVFRKNCRGFQLFILKSELEDLNKDFNLKISGVKSFSGEEVKLDIQGLMINNSYKYNLWEKKWKKF